MKLYIIPNYEKFDVWVTLDETEEFEVINATESFVISSGGTKIIAIKNALEELDKAKQLLLQEFEKITGQTIS